VVLLVVGAKRATREDRATGIRMRPVASLSGVGATHA